MKELFDYIIESSNIPDKAKIQEIIEFIDSLLKKKNLNEDEYEIKKSWSGIKIILKINSNNVQEISKYINTQLNRKNYDELIKTPCSYFKPTKGFGHGIEYKYHYVN